MIDLFKEFRYGVRMLARSPGFTLAAVLTLGLGIGANTAMFSLVNSILLQPLPVQDPDQIAVLAFQQKKGPIQNNFSVPELRDIAGQTQDVFSGVLGYQIGVDGLSTRGKADRVITSYVTGNFFPLLGLKPKVGRLILPSEGETPRADPVMVLSYAYWNSHFGGDPSIVGKHVSFNGKPVTVVGVAPEGFGGLLNMVDFQAYLPLGMLSLEDLPPDVMTSRAQRNIFVLARLRPGKSVADAQAALAVVSKRLAQDHPEAEKDLNLQVCLERDARPNSAPDPNNTFATIAALFLALAGIVLLLACGNVANIVLVRATGRDREIAIRRALGASKATLVRQLLIESLLLALVGGAAGILLGGWASSSLSALKSHTDFPIRLDFTFNWRVFTYALVSALVTGAVVGILPAFRASRGNLNEILRLGGRGLLAGRRPIRNILVTAQVAVSLVLLIVAGLFARSLEEVQRTNLGFDPSHVANFTMDPNEIGFGQKQGLEFYKTVLEKVRRLPGVRSASLANSVPLGYYSSGDSLSIDGYQVAPGQAPPSLGFDLVAPEYFSTMGIGIVSGRDFTDADNSSAPYVAIVNEAMAKKYWPGIDPIGRTFKIATEPAHGIRVAGVSRDSRNRGLTGAPPPYFYIPLAQHYAGNSLETLHVRTAGAPQAVIPDVLRAIGSIAPDLPVFEVKTMTQALGTLNGLLIFKVGAALAGVLGMLGLVLSVVGVYGVISYAAAQRTHEIGIRMALGARPVDILRRVFRHGLLIVGIGIAFGLAASFAASSIVGNLVVVSATDPMTYVSVSALLAAIALLASYVPARRAMRVDPVIALRQD